MRNVPGLIATFMAATAIPRYTVVALSAAQDKVELANDVADPILGISAEPADAPIGAQIDVILSGIAKAKAGASIAKGAWLTVDAQGRVITASAATNERIGRALEAANAANDVIPVLITHGLG